MGGGTQAATRALFDGCVVRWLTPHRWFEGDFILRSPPSRAGRVRYGGGGGGETIHPFHLLESGRGGTNGNASRPRHQSVVDNLKVNEDIRPTSLYGDLRVPTMPLRSNIYKQDENKNCTNHAGGPPLQPPFPSNRQMKDGAMTGDVTIYRGYTLAIHPVRNRFLVTQFKCFLTTGSNQHQDQAVAYLRTILHGDDTSLRHVTRKFCTYHNCPNERLLTQANETKPLPTASTRTHTRVYLLFIYQKQASLVFDTTP